jgi:DeoR/GlpR family transcriptional regulator of sugar metabolism/ABC-type sugar transport system substrate-binding protein
MSVSDRLDRIALLINQQGYATVDELSKLFQVSEMTIRRDLDRLVKQKRLRRTFGGAVSLHREQSDITVEDEHQFLAKPEGKLVDRVDVMVATSVNPRYDRLLIERLSKQNIPLVAESLKVQDSPVVVATDNTRAGMDLGRWAGKYAREHWGGQAVILDLTYHLTNTHARSQAFYGGVCEALSTDVELISLNAQSRYEMAYQLTRDALNVNRSINIIFAINDISARGAYNACQDMEIDPEDLIVLPFGLEGNTFKDALLAGAYCKAGLAMFPEIVGPVCIEAAISAYNQYPLPELLVTPYLVLTSDNLLDIYDHINSGWQLRWEIVQEKVHIPLQIDLGTAQPRERLPHHIGFIVPFMEHEWYQNLQFYMQSYARRLGIEIEVVDVDQDLANEMDFRRSEIAHMAASLVQPEEVILVDGGPIANFLAKELVKKSGLTIITNSIPVFEILRKNPDNILILTGGAFRQSSGVLVGPTAEGALRELRADKLFLMVAGISFDFGLSHTNISEVTIKQAMIQSAREMILLADHASFEQESTIQVAPLDVVHKIITDDALPASIRLDLSMRGIDVLLASI